MRFFWFVHFCLVWVFSSFLGRLLHPLPVASGQSLFHSVSPEATLVPLNLISQSLLWVISHRSFPTNISFSHRAVIVTVSKGLEKELSNVARGARAWQNQWGTVWGLKCLHLGKERSCPSPAKHSPVLSPDSSSGPCLFFLTLATVTSARNTSGDPSAALRLYLHRVLPAQGLSGLNRSVKCCFMLKCSSH